MVFGFIHQSGGFVDVFSETGKGTTFVLSLPVSNESLQKSDAAVISGDIQGEQELVWLAEDEMEVRETTRRILETLNYRVQTYSGGQEVLNGLDKALDLPRVLVSDIVMPRMNGTELLKEVRKRISNLPVLLVSGYADHFAKEMEIMGAHTAFLAKPYDKQQLGMKLRKLLEE